tara:strand:- start:341 stop:580 length:240 start_codon:yes stop_codon:yes gene_type:complete
VWNATQTRKDKMIYLLIRKFHIKDTNMKAEYRVEKFTDNVDEANKFLSALTLLEESKHISWHIVSHDFNEPLVLTKEVA